MRRPALGPALAALLVFAGCRPTPVPAPLRVLALGDSYTIGEGVDPADRWPVRLAAALRQEGVEVADPEIVAVTGWTTDELDAGIDRASPQAPFALVTLLIGVNDQYRGRDVAGYREGFAALLDRAVGFADGEAGRVVVVSIPDWGATAFADGRDREAIAHEIDAFNAAAAALARPRGARFVDVTPLSRTQGAQTVADGLHPTGEAYAAWVRLLVPAARAALASP